jgi:hypothetical protein
MNKNEIISEPLTPSIGSAVIPSPLERMNINAGGSL